MCKALTSQIHAWSSSFTMYLSHHDSFPSLLPSCLLTHRFHSHGQGQVCCVYRTNVFNSHKGAYRIGLGQFHGLQQYGCRDVIKTLLYVPYEKIIFTCKVPFILRLCLCILYSTKHDTIHRHSSFERLYSV